MIIRCLALFLVLCLATVALGSVSSAAAQAPATASGEWVVPRTPDGHPDLQGNWSSVTITPFEARIERGAQPSDPNRAPLQAGGRVGGYNNVYIDRGTNIAIVSGEPRSSIVTSTSDGRVPPLTPEGERRRAEYREFRGQFGQYDHPELRPLGERCIMSFGSSAGPRMIPNTFYNNYTIVQTADHVLIMAEMVHDARIIRIGDGPRLPDYVRPWMGDSWGRWEGDVLVVETTNLHPLQRFRGNSSDHLRVIERFSRVDEETILYQFTIHDPTTYARPWGGEVPMKALDDLLYEYACHEGNYSLSGILSGARYQERLDGQVPAELR